jgi:hypothetical protein
MAQPGQGKVHPGKRRANPMMTKNGKPRLGPLNLKQLATLLEKTSKKKEKAKIERRIARKTKQEV